ncbi:hypothetical protein [Paracoccus salsus]|uniref:hypothetical protein n=1 Tax=Paracoccus salsus TaxID=2911061 RepID=UPI001F293FA4|nr:hypothetical protein [Paracoccus salsus]
MPTPQAMVEAEARIGEGTTRRSGISRQGPCDLRIPGDAGYRRADTCRTTGGVARTEDEGWIDRFEGLTNLAAKMRTEWAHGSQIASVPAGAQVVAPGQSADNLMLLPPGSVRVQQRSETGREVFLYRVHAGESCVLTTA